MKKKGVVVPKGSFLNDQKARREADNLQKVFDKWAKDSRASGRVIGRTKRPKV